MDITEWTITENYWDYKVEKMLFTYDEKEQEEIKLAKKVYEQELWKLEYFTFYQIQLENGMSESQAILYNFIDWYTKTGRDFFYSNDTIWEKLKRWKDKINDTIKELLKQWYITLKKRIRAWWWTNRFIRTTWKGTPELLIRKNRIWYFWKTELDKSENPTRVIYNNNILYNNDENQNQEQSQDTNVSFLKQKDSNKLSKNSGLDIIKNSDDIRDIFDDDDIAQHKIQLKIILKMVELWYKVNKSKADIEKEFERLKAKAKLYWLIQWDWNIAWTTFYQKIDKRFDRHTEKWKKVKNFKTSIIPFISK